MSCIANNIETKLRSWHLSEMNHAYSKILKDSSEANSPYSRILKDFFLYCFIYLKQDNE